MKNELIFPVTPWPINYVYYETGCSQYKAIAICNECLIFYFWDGKSTSYNECVAVPRIKFKTEELK
jgi:hypothetical protein